MKKPIYILLLLLLNAIEAFAQYPQYFNYNTENGLPGYEVYSIVQDKKGFIWIGCDGGLFKFDGIRYTAYQCETQKSKSITGLTISSSGKMYCYNFQSQIFQLDNDSLTNAGQVLKELKYIFPNAIINNIASDLNGNIFVTHVGGISVYNENQKQWKSYFNYLQDGIIQSDTLTAKSVKGSLKKDIPFIYFKGIAAIKNDKVELIYATDLFQATSSGNFEIENYNDALWISSKESGKIYQYKDSKLKQLTGTRLNEVLANRKITNVKSLPDGNLWICTYKGIIRFNQKSNTTDLFYPELSFSDCMIDREHNYWFSTLQAGILRVPNLSYKVWNTFENNRLIKITNDNINVYFASVNGMVGKINTITQELNTFYTGSDADIQSLDYDFKDNTLYFNINNRLHQLSNNTLVNGKPSLPALKSYQKIGNTVFALTSHGIHINEKRINSDWARALTYDEQSNCVWIATNNGLQQYVFQNNEYGYYPKPFYSINKSFRLILTKPPDRFLLFPLTGIWLSSMPNQN